jgi:hypothetical protein
MAHVPNGTLHFLPFSTHATAWSLLWTREPDSLKVAYESLVEGYVQPNILVVLL